MQKIILLLTVLCLSLALAGTSLAGSLDIPVKGAGLSIGNSQTFAGLRLNFKDADLKRIDGVTVSIWKPEESPFGHINGISLGIGGTRAEQGAGLTTNFISCEFERFDGIALCGIGGGVGDMSGIGLGGLGLGGDDLTGIFAAGLGLGGDDMTGIFAAGLGVGGDDMTGIGAAGLGFGGNDMTGVFAAGLGMGGDDMTGVFMSGLGIGGDDMTGIFASGLGIGGDSLAGIFVAGLGLGGDSLTGLAVAGLGVGGDTVSGVAVGACQKQHERAADRDLQPDGKPARRADRVVELRGQQSVGSQVATRGQRSFLTACQRITGGGCCQSGLDSIC